MPKLYGKRLSAFDMSKKQEKEVVDYLMQQKKPKKKKKKIRKPKSEMLGTGYAKDAGSALEKRLKQLESMLEDEEF